MCLLLTSADIAVPESHTVPRVPQSPRISALLPLLPPDSFKKTALSAIIPQHTAILKLVTFIHIW